MNSEIDYDAVRRRIVSLMGDEKPYPWARGLGLAQGTFNRFWSKKETPKVETLHRIAMGAKVSMDWLLYGREDGGGAEKTSTPLPVDDSRLAVERLGSAIEEGDYVSIPFYSVRASAGPGAQPLDERPSAEYGLSRRALRQLGIATAQVIAMQVHGDSGLPNIADEDIILIDRSQRQLRDGYLYVIGVDDDVVVKRVERMMDRSILLKSDNPAYQPQQVSPEEAERLRIIGRVRWAVRHL